MDGYRDYRPVSQFFLSRTPSGTEAARVNLWEADTRRFYNLFGEIDLLGGRVVGTAAHPCSLSCRVLFSMADEQEWMRWARPEA